MFACSQAHPARGLFGWSEPQRARHGPQVDVVKLAATPWAPLVSLLHVPFLKSWLLPFLIAAGMVLWSPAGTRGSLPKFEEIDTM